jgi:hypothetical protein
MKSLRVSLKSPLWYAFVTLIAWAFIGVQPAFAAAAKCKDHDLCKEHDKCKQHDRGHTKCTSKPKDDGKKDHDDDKGKGDDKGKKNDKCKDHDRCKEHDKCKQHDRGHTKCTSKPKDDGKKGHDDDDDGGKGDDKGDKCKDHDRCKEHDKCREHDKGHDRCKSKKDDGKNSHDDDDDDGKGHDDDDDGGKGDDKGDKCKDHDRCKDHDKCREHDKGHDKCKSKKDDKCKDHDRCKEHDKCKQHDRGHARCQSKPKDQCKDHDRCKEHNKCKQHDKGHARCRSQREPTFAGQAVVVFLTNQLDSSIVLIGDTGPLLSAGGTLEVSVGPTNLMNALLIDMAHAITTTSGNRVHSEASIQEFSIRFMTTNGMEHTITFDHMQVSATAECTPAGGMVSASTQIADLEIDGVEVNVTGEANQVVNIDGGMIIINSQSSSMSSAHGIITAAGLQIQLDGSMEGSIGLAHGDIRCGSGPPEPRDCFKVFGSGAIRGTPSGDLGAFCLTAGKRGEHVSGRLQYLDYDTEMHVRSTAITGFSKTDQATVVITYNVKINGVAGTAMVEVSDKSKSGKADTFAIWLSNGYEASGILCRGNIKFRKCPKHCTRKCDGGHGNGDGDDGKGHDDDDDDGNNGDKCKDHDRCKEHDKCRQHDKGHDKCKSKKDDARGHDDDDD